MQVPIAEAATQRNDFGRWMGAAWAVLFTILSVSLAVGPGTLAVAQDAARSSGPKVITVDPPPEQEAEQGPVSIYLFGDALAMGVGKVLEESFKDDPNVEVVRKAKGSTGFVRSDYYDWNAELAKILEAEEPDIAVVAIGTNDRQHLRRNDGGHKFGTPEFKETYAARVDAFIAQLREKGATVFWLGLPIMRGKSYPAAMRELNEIYKARTQAGGAVFIDTWNEFADAVGAYSEFGPDVNGKVTRLRHENGVHFTRAGYAKLASLVERPIRELLASGAPEAATADAQSDEGEAGTAGDAQETAAAQEAAVPPATDPRSPAYRLLTLGERLDPKPGRADDFRWRN